MAVLTGIAGLMLTGCGSSPDDSGPASGGSGESGGASGAPGIPSAGEDDRPSPIEEFLGSGAADPVDQEWTEAERQDERRVGELVVACMKEEGFEYIAADPSPPELGQWDEYDRASLEFAEQFGYGLSTGTAPPEPEPDPNEEIKAGLSAAAQLEYRYALGGRKPGDGADYDEGKQPGCRSQAMEEVYDKEAQEAKTEEFFLLSKDISALDTRIDDDPRLAAAEKEWSACMAEAGHSGFIELDSASTEAGERAHELLFTEKDGIGSFDPDGVEPEALSELQKFERELATADARCRQQHVDEVREDVTFDLETEFVDLHRAELERYRGALAEVQTGGAG